MKLIIFIFIISLTQALGDSIHEKFSKSSSCIACHTQQGKDWLTSLHSKSHMSKNSLYMSILQYIEDTKFIYKETQALKCGQCHNPRMDAKDTDFEYAVSRAFEMENTESTKVSNALKNDTSKDGIACIVCHNIQKVTYKDSNSTKTRRGFKAITFGPNDVMMGPYKESHRTTFHKMKQAKHFKEEVNTLCYACHYSSTNSRKIPTYETGKEYELSKSSTKCVECHMGKVEKDFIAPKITTGTPAVLRDTRRHIFAGARNSDIMKSSVDVSLDNKDGFLYVSLKNTTPHKVPTGFASREMEIEIIYKNETKTLKRISKKLTTLYLDKKGNETISYIATKLAEDNRLNINEVRKYKIQNIYNATSVDVNIWYRTIKESLIPVLQIKDEIFLKKYPVYSKTIKL